MTSIDRARHEEDEAAAEAAAIGGQPSSDPDSGEDAPVDPAERPLAEAGQGESEGFEEAERELIEHATHGDQHAARRVIQDAPDDVEDVRADVEDVRADEAGEPDHERSAERPDDEG